MRPACLPPSTIAAVVWTGALACVGAENSFDPAALAEIDQAVEASIKRHKLPGGVLWIERDGQVGKKAFGERSTVPSHEEMTLDTIFDAASLTKVIATTPCVMKLIEEGRIGLDDKARKFLPELVGDANKERITIRHLLTHTSGLNAGIRRGHEWSGYDNGIALACGEPSVGTAGLSYRYSDLNFIILGEIVRRVSGQRLDRFAAATVFDPLKMTDTGFLPAESLRARIAPTTRMADGSVLRGTVHDPTARAMGGVAGHAGLFTSASDLARYCRSILNGGTLDGVRILGEQSVALMTSRQSPPFVTERRGLGWDIDSPYAGPRGTIFPIGSFGHTGWTGTSVWMDPFSRTSVIFLSNRNHPAGGSVISLRARLGALAATAVGLETPEVEGALAPMSEHERRAARIQREMRRGEVRNGIDVLVERNFEVLKGLKVGLVTNHTGVARDRTPSIDLLHNARECELVTLFSPEHGIRGSREGGIEDGIDEKTGLPIHSLYASKTRRKPTREQLSGLDALVIDLQDIGARFYTYASTMGLCMDAAEEAGIKLVVLDRVNPIGGNIVDGPVRVGEASFTSFHPVAVRHGMTMGELARMRRAEHHPGVDLTVVPVRGWKRDMTFAETGLPWISPSPNIRNSTAALIYPGLGLLEFTNLSVGRGTTLPFELLGAPYINPDELAAGINAAGVPGVTVVPVRFTPASSKFSGKECGGLRILVTDRQQFQAVDFGLVLAKTLLRLYPHHWDPRKLNVLLRHPATADCVVEGIPLEGIHQSWLPEADDFLDRRRSYLLYD